jgi:hypothetical protein
MADDVPFTPGSGATGAADDIGGVYYPRVKLSLGADGTAVDAIAGAGAVGTGVQRVTLASDDPAVSAIAVGVGKTASASFTPAASSHAGGDVNGAAAEFAFSAPSGCVFMITDAALQIDGSSAETSAWRVYLYTVTPPSALADNAVFDLPSGDRASFLGYIDLGVAVDLGSTQWVENRGIAKAVKLSGTSVFGYLVNISTQTPAAVAHTVKLTGVPI